MAVGMEQGLDVVHEAGEVFWHGGAGPICIGGRGVGRSGERGAGHGVGCEGCLSLRVERSGGVIAGAEVRVGGSNRLLSFC